jgi:hypothetical protein
MVSPFRRAIGKQLDNSATAPAVDERRAACRNLLSARMQPP